MSIAEIPTREVLIFFAWLAVGVAAAAWLWNQQGKA